MINTTGAPGVAAEDAADTQPASAADPVGQDCLFGVFRTGGIKTTVPIGILGPAPPVVGGERLLVEINEGGGELAHAG